MKLTCEVYALCVLLMAVASDVGGTVHQPTGDYAFSEILGTVGGRGVRLPISLEYRSGIKLNQRASWVGLGFDLTVPYIERVADGAADEKAGEMGVAPNDYNVGTGCREWHLDRNVIAIGDHSYLFGRLLRQNGNGYSVPNTNRTDMNPAAANINVWDYTSNQDDYYLNLPSLSGRIVFVPGAYLTGDDLEFCYPSAGMCFSADENTIPDPNVRFRAVLQQSRHVKVEYEIGQPSQGEPDILWWRITDENGTVYTFDKRMIRRNFVMRNGERKRTFSATSVRYKDGQRDPGTDVFTLGNHHPTEQYVIRWYLTSIRSPNDPDNADGVAVEYDEAAEFVEIRDLYHDLFFAQDRVVDMYQKWPLIACQKYRNEDGERVVKAIFGADDYYIKPVYVRRINGTRLQAEFERSPSHDVTTLGRAQLDRISIRTRDGKLQHAYEFVYDETGHAVGHPYCTRSDKGLLKLRSLIEVAADGQERYLYRFEYGLNPAFPGKYNHDFFGYYSRQDVRQLGDPYTPGEGHSTVDAAAWSLTGYTSGTGGREHVTYEPNTMDAMSTNEDIPRIYGPGVRVRAISTADGLGNEHTTTYTYGKGYTNYNVALAGFNQVSETTPQRTDAKVDELCLLINYEDLRGLENILLLQGQGVMYDRVTAHTSVGRTVTEYLSPSDVLPRYNPDFVATGQQSQARQGVSLADGKFGKCSKAAMRGAPKRVATYGLNVPERALVEVFYNYEAEQRRDWYAFPRLQVESDLYYINPPTGSIGDPPSMPSLNDMLKVADTAFVSIVRFRSQTRSEHGVGTSTTYMYNDPQSGQSDVGHNGLIRSQTVRSATGESIREEVTYAYEQDEYAAMDAAGKHMLAQQCATTRKHASPGHNGGAFEVATASATRWSNFPGSGWHPQATYRWNSECDDEGWATDAADFPVFNFNPGVMIPPPWVRMVRFDKYDSHGNSLLRQAADLTYTTQLFDKKWALPLASFQNCRYAHAYYDGFESGQPWTLVPSGTALAVRERSKTGSYALKITNSGASEVCAQAPWQTADAVLFSPLKFDFSCWVYTTGPQAELFFFASVDGPAYETGHFTSVHSAGGDLNKWVQLKGSFEAPVGARYFSVRVDNNGGSQTSAHDIYFDDLVFYPQEAMPTIVCRDETWLRPVMTFDADRSFSTLVDLDGYGRKVGSYLIDPEKGTADDGYMTLLSTKEYHTMGDVSSETLRLLSPNGAERYVVGDTVCIRWIAGDGISMVTARYSTDLGDTWQTIGNQGYVRTDPQWGRLAWEIPSTAVGECIVQVADAVAVGKTAYGLEPFTVVERAIAAPTLVSPAHGSTVTGELNSCALAWSRANIAGVRYDVYLSPATPPNVRIASGIPLPGSGSPSVTAEDLYGATTYHWRVVAYNDNGDTTIGPVWKFVTDGGFPFVECTSPPESTWCLPHGSATLSWNATTGTFGAPITFDLLLGTSPAAAAKHAEPHSSNVSATRDGETYTFTVPSGVKANTRYYWRVKATKGGLSSYSDMLTFRTLPQSNTAPVFSGTHWPAAPEGGAQHAQVAVSEEDGYRMVFAWACSDEQSPSDELRFKLYFAKHIRYCRSSQQCEWRYHHYEEMPIRYVTERDGMRWFVCDQAIAPCRKGVPTGIWDTDESGQSVQLVGWEYGYWYVVASDGCTTTESPRWIVEVLNEQGGRDHY